MGLNDDFLGPAALNRAFVMLLDSRSVSTPDGLDAVANEQGLWRCHTLFECTAVCPQGNLAYAGYPASEEEGHRTEAKTPVQDGGVTSARII